MQQNYPTECVCVTTRAHGKKNGLEGKADKSLLAYKRHASTSGHAVVQGQVGNKKVAEALHLVRISLL